MTIKNKITFITALIISTTAISGLNLEKLNKYFPDDRIVSTKHMEDNIFEIQIIEKESIIKKSTFFTNDSIDWISPSIAITKDDGGFEEILSNVDYTELDLNKFSPITIGTGDEVNHFINITTEIGIKTINKILVGNGMKNNIFIHFNKDDREQLLFSIESYYGTNDDRVKSIKNMFQMMIGLSSGSLTPDKANQMMERSLDNIRNSSSMESLRELSDRMKMALELSDIFAKGSEYLALNNKNEPYTQQKTVSFSQKIDIFDFSEYGSDLQKALKASTAFTMGSGDEDIYIFSDIDCPACNALEYKLKTSTTNKKYHILYFPLQEIHPNALDKSRYVLSLNNVDREQAHAQISGTGKAAISSRIELSKLKLEKLNKINEKISMSTTLGQLLKVSSTPTILKFENNKIIKSSPQDILK